MRRSDEHLHSHYGGQDSKGRNVIKDFQYVTNIVRPRRLIHLLICKSANVDSPPAPPRSTTDRHSSPRYSLTAGRIPNIFAHILRYLRREVLPVVYKNGYGFDPAFYRALQVEALYFGVDPLQK